MTDGQRRGPDPDVALMRAASEKIRAMARARGEKPPDCILMSPQLAARIMSGREL